MPRPAPKRNRSTKAPQPAAEPKSRDDKESHPESPEHRFTLDSRQTLRSQTPLATNHEQAIESSPGVPGTGSRPGTDSRPPTRSRGYSSTLSFAGRKGDMNSRIPGTPGFESSVLSNFRRRPRQQSILQMMQAEDGSSDLDDEDFLGGLSPQDESTPLNLPRGKSLLVNPGEKSPSLSPSPSLSSSSPGGSRKRKREEIQVPQSSIEEAPGFVQDSPSITPARREISSHEPEEETPRPIPFPEIFSQTMALPASSPPPPESTQVSIPAVPSPAVPNRASKNTKPKDQAQLATAALRDRLLPRRRQPRRRRQAAGNADLLSDESDDGMHAAASGDEDELSYLPSKRSQRAPSSKANAMGSKQNQSNPIQKRTKSKSAPAPKAPRGQKPVGGDVDKENELLLSSPSSSPLSSPPDSDASESETETVSDRRYMSAELRDAAKKFAEIDQWQMEFEEISASESHGSPAR
ncbi:hypothetical protein N7466_009943 [Penicillium verhagenii]|uniref:uncharacterized protein n=1 Tax=Penicillium verhagenii TaxID=1562060 RepID=UPI0025456CD9|nr:uncharacterized protein N7466_009943 [Penicillium verhagenii]KAJ5919000.1 hypothetical protein N7466_009943 [Penicillium verhagenii]